MSENILADVLNQVYQKKSSVEADIIEGIRVIFASRGYEILFDYPRLKGYLWDVAPMESVFRKRFALIYESGAIDCIREATLDAYHYAEHFEAAEKKLLEGGLSAQAAHDTAYIFYEALGFPTDRKIENPQRIGGAEGWIYFGEVKDGKPHGRGREELIYGNTVYDVRIGLWIRGQVYGYLYSEEKLGMKEYRFCVNGMAIGKDTYVADDGQMFVDEFEIV